MSDILNYYKKATKFAGMLQEEDGYTCFRPDVIDMPDAGKNPVLVLKADKKQLALPTDDFLEKPELLETMVGFHPLSESALCAESPVIDTFRMHGLHSLSSRLVALMTEIVTLACDNTAQEKLSDDQIELMSKIITPPGKTCVKAINDLISKGQFKPTNIITAYLKRGGVFEEADVLRLCTVRSPILAKLGDVSRTIDDSDKLTKDNYAAIAAMLRYILTPVNEGSCDHGSNNPVAPYWDALIKSYVKVQEHINEIATTLKEHLESFHLIYVPVKDLKQNDKNFREWSGLIPVLPENSGATIGSEEEFQTHESEKVSRKQPDLAPTTVVDNGGWSGANDTLQNKPKTKAELANMSTFEREAYEAEQAKRDMVNSSQFLSREQVAFVNQNNGGWGQQDNGWGNNGGWNNGGGFNNGGWGQQQNAWGGQDGGSFQHR